MNRLLILPALLLTLLMGTPASSADYQKGLTAYRSGDYATALREWTPLAEQGNAVAQYNLGLLYANGWGVPQDNKTAVKWFRLAAEQGYARAQYNLGVMYANGRGVPQDYKTAEKWYRLAAEQGYARAQFNLGQLYRRGDGVPQNYKTAVKWYRLAENQGNALAQTGLGLMYENGQGVPKNYRTAVKWYRLAAEQGNADAQANLGKMYGDGKGVPQDNKTAVKWFRLAAEQGYARAQYNLGVMYNYGKGVLQNYKTAVKWFRLAAEQGYVDAQYNLGVMYATGQGVVKDNVYAHMWLNIAASSGDKGAVKNRDAIAKKMTPSQLSKAQDLARNFVPRKGSTPVIARKPPTPTPPTRKSPTPTPRSRAEPDRVISASSGSGFAVSTGGYVITNYHVIEGCQKVKIHHNGETIPAIAVTYDPKNDLALLKGDFRPSTVLSLSTKSPELLQDVYVAGFPFGRKVSTGVKVTKGIISSLTGIGNNFSNIQIDAALQPGNSGGPILNDRGNVVGVAVARLDKVKTLKKLGSLPENTNFGIKTSVVRSILESKNISSRKPNTKSISKTKLGKMIADGTYYLSCWMTTAQIEKMRSKKVIFQNLD